MFNTPVAGLVVLAVVVAINAYLFFGYYLPGVSSPTSTPAPRTERTNSPETTAVERTAPETTEERVRPTTTPAPKTTATATATASP